MNQPDIPGIIREMAYTPYAASCRDLLVTKDGELVECRRDRRHIPAGVHACHGGTEPDGVITWAYEAAVTSHE